MDANEGEHLSVPLDIVCLTVQSLDTFSGLRLALCANEMETDVVCVQSCSASVIEIL